MKDYQSIDSQLPFRPGIGIDCSKMEPHCNSQWLLVAEEAPQEASNGRGWRARAARGRGGPQRQQPQPGPHTLQPQARNARHVAEDAPTPVTKWWEQATAGIRYGEA